MRNKLLSVTVLTLLLIASCGKPKDDDEGPGPGPGGNNDPATITSISPEFIFWGEQLTINGTGFSTTKTDNFVWIISDDDCGTNPQDSTDWKKAEVVSATATKLIIKVPHTISTSGLPCGPDLSAGLRVTVKGKSTVVPTQGIKPMGFPYPVAFCDDYPGYHGPLAIRPGDSVLLKYGGGGMIPLHNSGNQSKIRLMIGSTPVPVKLRPGVTGCSTYGIAFQLGLLEFAKPGCTPLDPTWGLAGETMPMRLYIDGVTQATVTKNIFVANLPKGTISSTSGPLIVSKSAGGNPFWTVKGKSMHYRKVKFIAASPCTGSVEASTVCNSFCDEFNFNIPLSLLTPGCSYGVFLIDACDQSKSIGGIKINP